MMADEVMKQGERSSSKGDRDKILGGVGMQGARLSGSVKRARMGDEVIVQ